jgi:hypothetical protein
MRATHNRSTPRFQRDLIAASRAGMTRVKLRLFRASKDRISEFTMVKQL